MSQLLLFATSIIKIVKIHSPAPNATLKEKEQRRPLRLVRARALIMSDRSHLGKLGQVVSRFGSWGCNPKRMIARS